MHKLLYFVISLVVGSTCYSQQYSFLSASSKKVKYDDYIDFLNEHIGKHDSIHKSVARYLDNGSTFTTAYSDSVYKSKDNQYYTTITYKDTVANSYSFVLHKRTNAEVKENEEYWKNYFKEDEKNRKKLKGSVVNDLNLTDMNGVTHTLESLQGKIIVIDFWFVNCGACIQEMSELNKMKEHFDTDNVAYFGVTYDKREKVEKFLKRTKFDFDVVPDSKHLTDRFGIKFYPTTLVLDLKREIVFTGEFAPVKSRTQEIEKVLKKLTKNLKTGVVAGPLQKQ